ncbi:MAG: GMC family oxidoreductase [Pseudomonadota bacterium]
MKNALRSPDVGRVLVLERGKRHSYQWQLEKGAHNDLDVPLPHRETGLRGKWWNYNIGFGGGSNCWWTNAMRIHPADFELKSRYGVGVDWPLNYEDLEPYYCDAEEEMFVSGDNASDLVFPRSRPFPQPRHRYSDIGLAMKAAYPDTTFAMPTTRGRVSSETRGVCCAVGQCGLCPNSAKFTIAEEMAYLFDDPRVELVLEAEATAIETAAGQASGVVYRKHGAEHSADARFVALAGNGIFNPFLLLKSGIDDGPVGKGVTEQIPIYLSIDFEKTKNQGYSSLIGAVSYAFADGPQRATGSGGFLEIMSRFRVRPNADKWCNNTEAVLLLGDLRSDENRVSIDPDAPDQPLVTFHDWTSYARAGVAHVKDNIEAFLAPLGVDGISARYGTAGTHSHIEGSTVMGNDPKTSVVDRDLRHHKVRNLAVLGSGAFPTSPGSNPSLTIAALSLRSADRIFGLGAPI